MQIIKKDKRTKNKYLRQELWIRDLTNSESIPVDINDYYTEDDRRIINQNESQNISSKIPRIGEEKLTFENVVIISDGLNFETKKHELEKLPKNVAIFATNRSLLSYNLKKTVNLYVANNPYPECIQNMPATKYFPAAIMSYKTNYEFVKKYKGMRYLYEATPENFVLNRKDSVCFDDYRNPICAAISIAYHCKVKKLLLFCCDKSFINEKPGSVKLKNGYYTYQHNIMADNVIDGQLYWLKEKGIKIGNYSSGNEYNNSTYIQNEDGMEKFFNINGVME